MQDNNLYNLHLRPPTMLGGDGMRLGTNSILLMKLRLRKVNTLTDITKKEYGRKGLNLGFWN